MTKKTRHVIFLDIDGVLQPWGRQDRFNHDLEQLKKDLASKYNNDEYLEMDRYDLGAVRYDWDKGIWGQASFRPAYSLFCREFTNLYAPCTRTVHGFAD